MSSFVSLQNRQNFVEQQMESSSHSGILHSHSSCGIKNADSALHVNESFMSQNSAHHALVSTSILSDEMSSEKKRTDEDKPRDYSTTRTMAASVASFTQQILQSQSIGTQWKDCNVVLQNDKPSCSDLAVFSDPLLQKLAQLKEIQQQKQEELKRQQMQQLQRLLDEQQKLLDMVSAQQACPEKMLLEQRCGSPVSHPDSRGETPYLAAQTSQDVSGVDDPLSRNSLLFVSSSKQSSSQQRNRNDPSSLNSSCLEAINCTIQSLMPVEERQYSGSDKDDDLNNTDGQKCEKTSRNDDMSLSPNGVHLEQNLEMEPLASEERPIKSAIVDGKQTFEEYLEEQLRLEEQKLKQQAERQVAELSPDDKSKHKRTFLRRREGLNRFINAKPSTVMEMSENETKLSLHPKPVGFKNGTKITKQQMQRKTAAVSKEHHYSEIQSIPRNKINQAAKTSSSHALSVTKVSVLGNHNGQNSSQLTLKKQTRNKMHAFPQHLDTESDQNNRLEVNRDGLSEQVSCGSLNSLINTGSCRASSGSTSLPTLNHLSAHTSQKCADFSFEQSFQKKLEQWDVEKEKENIELDEFEFLEQAAEDISFSSNSSFVQKILHKDQRNSVCRRLSSTPIKTTHQKRTVELDVDAVNYRNKHEQGPVNQKCDTKQTVTVHSLSNVGLREPLTNFNTVSQEVCIVKTAENIKMDGGDGYDESFSCSESELDTTVKNKDDDDDDQILVIKKNNEDNAKCQDHREDSEMGIKVSPSRSNDFSKPDEDYSSDESNVVRHEVKKSAAEHLGSHSPSINHVAFDDETTWTDLDCAGNLNEVLDDDHIAQFPTLPSLIDEKKCSASDKEIKRKVATRKRGDSSAEKCATDNEFEPPTSELMAKLFPSLKPKQKTIFSEGHCTPLNSTKQQPVDVAQSQVLRKKLVELETEIERFRAENAALTKLHEERENSLENLRKEIADFEKQKKTELSNLEEYKKEELRKLQKERKVFEKYAAAARAVPDKKEREEIQTLKQELTSLQEELKHKEMRWSATHNRLRNQIEALTKENTELREEIRVIEKLRLEAWKKSEDAENCRNSESIPTHLKRVGFTSSPANTKANQNGAFPVLPALWKKQVDRITVSPTNGKQSSTSISLPFGDLCSLEEPRTKLTDSSELDFQTENSTHNSPSSMFAENSGTLPKQISGCTVTTEEIQEEMRHPDGKVELVMKNGHRIIIFPNGTRKDISADGKTITVIFFNGDVKQVMPDQRVIYYYADAKTTHTTFTDGLEVLHFPNNQIEKHYPDGRKEITFPDQTIKNLYTDGQEESIFPDGTILRIHTDGSKIIEFNNGQKELHTLQFKRREYPDGTVKTVYANGQQETKYPTGRVRVKDKDGNVIMDSRT